MIVCPSKHDHDFSLLQAGLDPNIPSNVLALDTDRDHRIHAPLRASIYYDQGQDPGSDAIVWRILICVRI